MSARVDSNDAEKSGGDAPDDATLFGDKPGDALNEDKPVDATLGNDVALDNEKAREKLGQLAKTLQHRCEGLDQRLEFLLYGIGGPPRRTRFSIGTPRDAHLATCLDNTMDQLGDMRMALRFNRVPETDLLRPMKHVLDAIGEEVEKSRDLVEKLMLDEEPLSRSRKWRRNAAFKSKAKLITPRLDHMLVRLAAMRLRFEIMPNRLPPPLCPCSAARGTPNAQHAPEARNASDE
ncbi:MAG: hypothetical protein M1833_006728 [Piccolia ochrophora]|nr:MAG: hypothetical protein M1833_006728 [Piccolia ochrophora]